jgi:hypothetical protein
MGYPSNRHADINVVFDRYDLHPDMSGLFWAVVYGYYPVPCNTEHLTVYPPRCPDLDCHFLPFGKDKWNEGAPYHPKVPDRVELEFYPELPLPWFDALVIELPPALGFHPFR